MQEMAQIQTERFRMNVASRCAEHGMVQEVAEKAGISRVYLSRVINGHAIPTIDIAARIADALGEPLGRLLEKSPKKFAAAG